jgi:hypothetical protein
VREVRNSYRFWQEHLKAGEELWADGKIILK